MAARSKPAEAGVIEFKKAAYMAPGQAPSGERAEPTIDSELEEIRDAEAKANDVDISGSREEPTIDPALVEARDAERKQFGLAPIKARDAEAPQPKKTTASKSSSSK